MPRVPSETWQGRRETTDEGEWRSVESRDFRADEASVRDDVEHSGRADGGARILVVGDEGKSVRAPAGESNGGADDAGDGDRADGSERGLIEGLNGVIGGARLCGGLTEDEDAAESVVDDEQAGGAELAYLCGGGGVDDLAVVVVDVPGGGIEVDLAADSPERVGVGAGESDSGRVYGKGIEVEGGIVVIRIERGGIAAPLEVVEDVAGRADGRELGSIVVYNERALRRD